MSDQTSDEEEPLEPEASRPRLILRPADWNNATEETEELGEDEPVPDEGLCCIATLDRQEEVSIVTKKGVSCFRYSK